MTSTMAAAITAISGDPDAIRATGRRWRTAAMACAAAAAQVGAVAVVDGFLGDEAGTWEQRLESDTSTVLSTLATARDIVGGALASYAEVLETCQQELRALAVHRTEAGAALDRWRDTPTAESDLIDSATQTVHDLDARSSAILARHVTAVRACCVQIDRATAMSPGDVAGVRPGVASVRTGGGPGRFRQSSNAVMVGFRLSQPAQLSAGGPFLATDDPQDTDGNSQWIDPATRERYYQQIYEHCMVKQSFMGNGEPDNGLGLTGGCQGYADSALTSDQTLIQVLNENPGLIAMIPLPKTTFGSVWSDYMGMLRDMGSMTVDGVTTVMFSGCKEGGSIGACLFDIASAPIPFVKGAKAIKAGVEVFDDGADVVKAGEKAAEAGRAAEARKATEGAAPARKGPDTPRVENPANASIDENKFKYFFGKVKPDSHNTPRAAQNEDAFERIGLYDNAQGRGMLRDNLIAAANTDGNVVRTFTTGYGSFEVRESLLQGPLGFTKLESTWQVTSDGPRLTTVVPKEPK